MNRPVVAGAILLRSEVLELARTENEHSSSTIGGFGVTGQRLSIV
jgi:hypothetical protein